MNKSINIDRSIWIRENSPKDVVNNTEIHYICVGRDIKKCTEGC
jgi:hypothetical protein